MKIIKPKITNGPWRREGNHIIANDGIIPAQGFTRSNIDAIAALPDVLEALAWALVALNHDCKYIAVNNKAKQALEKAGYKFEE